MRKKTLENICFGACLGSGIALQLTAYYLKYVQPAIYYRKGMYREAAASHAMGYLPSVTAKVLLASAGVMYLSENEHLIEKITRYKYLRFLESHISKRIKKRKNAQ